MRVRDQHDYHEERDQNDDHDENNRTLNTETESVCRFAISSCPNLSRLVMSRLVYVLDQERLSGEDPQHGTKCACLERLADLRLSGRPQLSPSGKSVGLRAIGLG